MRGYNIPWLLCLTARGGQNALPHSDPDICAGYCIGDLYNRLETSDGAHSSDFIFLRIIGLTPANDVIGTTNASSTGMDSFDAIL